MRPSPSKLTHWSRLLQRWPATLAGYDDAETIATEAFRHSIRTLRRRGFLVRQIGEAVGLSGSVISRVYTGKLHISGLSTLRALIAIREIDISLLAEAVIEHFAVTLRDYERDLSDLREAAREIGEYLHIECDMSLAAIAREIGVDYGSLRYWIGGHVRLPAWAVERVCGHFLNVLEL
jgi:transcriptional regulator with XRE-family HTH domain